MAYLGALGSVLIEPSCIPGWYVYTLWPMGTGVTCSRSAVVSWTLIVYANCSRKMQTSFWRSSEETNALYIYPTPVRYGKCFR